MTISHPHLHLQPDQIYPFDARGIAKRFRHAAIFGALDALNSGETMRFVNDHWVSPKFTDTLLSPDSVFRTLPD